MIILLVSSTIKSQHFTFFTEMLWMHLTLVANVQPIWLLQGSLFMGIHQNMTLDTFLAHVCPRISTHPFPFALSTFVLSEASLFALIWGQSFPLRSSLRTIFDVVSLCKAEVTQICRWWSFVRFAV